MNWLSVALLPLYLFLLIQVELASAQTDSVAFTGKPDFFNGVVINRKKYSFSVAFDKNPGTVRLSPNTTIAARIVRPSFDWGAQVVRGVIPVSAEDGRVVNNREVEFALPDKLYFRYSFESPAAMAKMLELETIQLEQPVLSRTILPDAIIDGDNPQWTGQLQPTAKPGLFQVTLNGRKKIIQSEWNTLLLEGFSILDLEPFETDVFINGDSVDGEILARRIEFARRLNLKSVFGSAHPKCLVIGDRVSMNYLPALINELEGEVKIHHPNANCLGSSSYKNLARWAGPNTPDFHWDLIVFNFGLSDSEMKKADYQANLRKCIQLLQARAKKLVWIESTPVPYGFNDANLKSGQFIPEEKRFDFEFEELQPVHLKPGRMKLQNQWAAQLLEEFPQVETCRLWEVVKRDETGVFKNWWYGKTISFHRNQSGPLAVSLGNSIRSALQSFAE